MNRKPKTCDPLADHFARRRIDMAQFMAGREFQKHFRIADRRSEDRKARGITIGFEWPDALTADQQAVWKWLAKCYQQLGKDGCAIVHDALIDGKTTKQIAESRGKTGLDWERFYARRLWECLATLAEVYGFANGGKRIRASGTKMQIIGAQ